MHMYMWDVEEGRRLWTAEGQFATCLTMTADGSRLLYGTVGGDAADNVGVRDAESGEQLLVTKGGGERFGSEHIQWRGHFE